MQPQNALASRPRRRYGLDIGWGRRVEALARVGDGWSLQGDDIDPAPFDAAIIAVPAEQVPPLVADYRSDWAAQARATPSEPCWTVMVAYLERLQVGPDRLTDGEILASAVRNSSKPGRAEPEACVLQASGSWSAAHIEDAPKVVQTSLLAAFHEQVGQSLPAPITTSVHRWRFAKSGSLGRDALWDGLTGLGLCGDWLIGGRVEAAWLSGQKLAHKVLVS